MAGGLRHQADGLCLPGRYQHPVDFAVSGLEPDLPAVGAPEGPEVQEARPGLPPVRDGEVEDSGVARLDQFAREVAPYIGLQRPALYGCRSRDGKRHDEEEGQDISFVRQSSHLISIRMNFT